ncbi:MAG: hypothetical protein WC720_05445 [Candidatus Shapirobacteria bacterium]|jgi:hypothetical protein
MLNKKIIQEKALVEEMIQQFYETTEENKELKDKNGRLENDKSLLMRYEKDYRTKVVLLELQEDRILELKQERNKLKRELNRVTYNKIKTIAVILSLEDQNYYYKLYKGDMNKCSIQWKQYVELNEKEQKAWREYANYYYRLSRWSLDDGKY